MGSNNGEPGKAPANGAKAVMLYVDGGREGQQVEQLLKQHDVQYAVIEARKGAEQEYNLQPPYLVADGEQFEGLREIQGYVRVRAKESRLGIEPRRALNPQLLDA